MKRTIRLRESELKKMISESVKNILQEHDQEALGRLSARNLEKSADLEKEMGQSGVFPKDKINRMRHHDKMAHKANRLQHELMGLDPDKNFGHLTHPDFGKGFNDVQDEYHKLRRGISESVRRVLKEGGHLYHKDDDGNVWTNSKETYRGVPGSVYIWHGEWSDPEILWDGVELNANDVEEGLWYSYKDDCEENGQEPTNEGYEAWLEEMGTDYIASQLDDLVWAANGNP